MSERIILRFCDWNRNLHLYEAPIGLIQELVDRFKESGFKSAWTWWTKQIDYSETGELPVRRISSNKQLDTVYLDFHNPEGSIGEWAEILK